jgi:hypothetical protein
MARLHKYQGKAILAANGFKIPRGRAASTADDAVVAARDLDTANKDSELLGCDVECRLAGVEGVYLELDVPGLGEVSENAPALVEKR